jgi:hypothetical protein
MAAVFFMLISLYGPQSAFTLSRNLQENRFIAVLESNEMIKDGEIISRSDLPADAKEEISDFMRYFSNYHEFEDIEILPQDFELNDMEQVFGFEHYYYVPSTREVINYHYMNRNMAIDVSDYNYLVEMDFNLEESKEYLVDDWTINYISNADLLTFKKNGETLAEINLVDMIKSFDERHEGSQINTIEEATIEYNFDDIKIKIIIGDIYYQKSDEETEKFYSNIYFKTLIQ